MSDKATFREAFASTCQIDGIVFKFDTPDEQRRQQIANRLKLLLQEATGGEVVDWKRLFKVQVFNMTGDRTRAIVKFGLYGDLCRAATKLPASLLHSLFEVHFKSWAYDMDEEGYNEFRKAMVFSTAGRQASVFGNKANPNSSKGAGNGVRIGDRNSDFNFVLYRRQSQRMGVELRVKDKACFTRAVKALDFATAYGGDDASAWYTAISTLQHAACQTFVRDLRGKHQDMDWLHGLSTSPYHGADNVQVPFRFELDSDDDVKVWASTPLDF